MIVHNMQLGDHDCTQYAIESSHGANVASTQNEGHSIGGGQRVEANVFSLVVQPRIWLARRAPNKEVLDTHLAFPQLKER